LGTLADAIQKEVVWSTWNLLNLTVSVLFFDTSNTSFEADHLGLSDVKGYVKSSDK